ncbi:branched-chain amino acid ABC transporter permease [Acrocarpospora pleiomorpha]|uniref:Branched-chain amino acid ABC transporter permease n=1 Tax=Acrocarpospora pleiomorpha TaxID=90975 RepID=A0A5M3XJB5_9ACTN|nr:branched-chain amino acid ABC transporter permease [Acrocarpospora pleiomorpha]
MFFQQIVDGISSGAIYALLGLAIVMVHRGSGVANFAQGEMAMLAAYIAWQVNAWGAPWALAMLAAVGASFGIGMLVERLVARRAAQGSVLTVVIVTLGLFLVINQSAGYLWTFEIKDFRGIMPSGVWSVGGVAVSYDAMGVVGALVLCGVGLYLLLSRTRVGLAMRAATSNPESAALVGIRTSRVHMFSWGLAGSIGAVAGVMVAPRLFLEPSMMFGSLLFAFAAVTVGGLDSPLGAVIGGLLVGISENLAGTYVDFIGSDLKIAVPLLIIVLVLIVRPAGMFGNRSVTRA